MRIASLLLASLLLPGCLGCSRISAGTPTEPNASDRNAELKEIRREMERIPAPAKSRYLAVKSLDSWQNPYLTVQGGMVTLHVLVADANTSELGLGGMLRPVGARRQDLNVRTSDLPAAVNSIPDTSWPYGRVVAVEEAHNTPASAEPEVRRNLEAAVKTLGDVGVVVHDWQDAGASLR